MKPRERKAMWWLFALAVGGGLMFVAWLNLAPPQYRPTFAVVAPDSSGYLALARGIASGEGYQFGGDFLSPTRIPPLYSYFLALLSLLAPLHPIYIGCVQALLGGATTVLLYHLGLIVHRPSAAVGAGIYAIYPHALLSTVPVLKETFSVFILVAFALVWVLSLRKLSPLLGLGAGLLIGLSVMSRYLHLGLVPLVLLTHLFYYWKLKEARRRLVLLTLPILLGFVVGLSPWLIRNYRLTGELVLSTHGPMRYLYNANTPLARPETWGYYEAQTLQGQEWDRQAQKLAGKLNNGAAGKDGGLLHYVVTTPGQGMFEREKSFLWATLVGALSDPVHLTKLVGAKMINTWRPVWAGSSKLTWLAIGIPHIVLMLLSLVGALRTVRLWRANAQAESLIPLAMVLFFVGAHAVLYGMIRSRLYPLPFLCCLAGYAIWGMVRRPRRKQMMTAERT